MGSAGSESQSLEIRCQLVAHREVATNALRTLWPTRSEPFKTNCANMFCLGIWSTVNYLDAAAWYTAQEGPAIIGAVCGFWRSAEPGLSARDP